MQAHDMAWSAHAKGGYRHRVQRREVRGSEALVVMILNTPVGASTAAKPVRTVTPSPRTGAGDRMQTVQPIHCHIRHFHPLV